MEHQQFIGYQRDLFVEEELNSIRQFENCNHVECAGSALEGQLLGAINQGRALAGNLIGMVCSRSNLSQAFKQVKRNKGVAGIDQLPVGDFAHWYQDHGTVLISSLLRGTYYPEALRMVKIPKSNGGQRQLGIPTVKDRIIQQAVSQILTPIYESEFSDFSYGFRPKRSAHQALHQASTYVNEGRSVVVDMDMKSFFDEVNHDRLMRRLSSRIKDRALLLLIRRYLQSGIMVDGLVSQRIKGTPQGSPLSPLLSNIVLDELDKELERRGHHFVRYADDFSIFVRSPKAGERVKKSISAYLTIKLKLRVNEDKSVVCMSHQTKFLAYTIQDTGCLTIASSSVKRLKGKVRKLCRRNRSVSLETLVSDLRPVLRGWLNYFKYASCSCLLRNLDAWIRRKLRCFRLKQCKRTIGIKRFLTKLGVKSWQSWILALSGKGWWRLSGCPQAHQAMNLQWFIDLGLYNMSVIYKQFKHYSKPPCTRVRTVV
jgi:group II intron reverse transcriptase/maturase